MPVWSKLKSGRIPQGNELLEIINNQLDLSNSQFPKTPPGQPQYEQDNHNQNIEDEQQHHDTTSNGEEDFKEFDTDDRVEL